MEDEEVVFIKVIDDLRGDVVFEGKVSTNVRPDELVMLRCFRERYISGIRNKATGDEVTCFKGLQNVELVACSDDSKEWTGVLYVGVKDGVLRKSKTVPSCECVSMSLWNLSHEECEKVFKCETLEELSIRQGKLRQIPKEIGKMKKLKYLSLHELQELTSIPDEIGELCYLVELQIEDCAIESLPKGIGGLKQLEKLKLSYLINLAHLPEEIGQLTNLKELKIYECPVVSLPRGFEKLQQLQKLVIVRLNDLEDSHVIWELSNLKELDIRYCPNVRLPSTIGKLQHLEILWLEELDDLKVIPEEMGQMSKLEYLGVFRSPIESLPKSLKHLKHLKEMHLMKVPCLRFCPEDMEVFLRLKRLSVYDCANVFKPKTNWDALKAFCEMIKMSVNLRYVFFDFGEEDPVAFHEALRLNGSVVEGKLLNFVELEDIIDRNKSNHAKALESVVSLMAIRRFRRGMVDVPKEMVEMIGTMLWITRCDVDAWTQSHVRFNK